MLKSILLVIAIIITFDIGIALLKSCQVEKETPAPVKEVVDDVKPEQVQLDKTETEKALEDVPVLINLELPEELPEATTDADSHELEQEAEQSEKSTSLNFNSSQIPTKDKKISLSAKPIVTFEEESVEKPRIDGASVGIKVQLE